MNEQYRAVLAADLTLMEAEELEIDVIACSDDYGCLLTEQEAHQHCIAYVAAPAGYYQDDTESGVTVGKSGLYFYGRREEQLR